MNLDDLAMVRGALDSMGVALANHHHQWSVGEREIFDQSHEIIASWADDCIGIDSLASETLCSRQPSHEPRLLVDRASILSLASECSLWRAVAVASLLVVSTSCLRFRYFCSFCLCGKGCSNSQTNTERTHGRKPVV